MSTSFLKDPSSILDYQWNWTAWLPAGDTISSHTVTVPTGLTLETSSATTTAVTAWISGGTAETECVVTCRIVTTQGRTDERSITLKVTSR